MSSPSHIVVRGAREHNLKDVDVEIPRDALVVFTGVSGSGKSSLAYDTVFKEGQRRFLESLSAYARQFLGQMERPRVESVDGISPTLSIDQKTVNRNPRSTVGTVTEIYDHIRLLMARLGTPHCPECGLEVSKLAPEQVVEALLEQAAGERALVLGPVVRARKGEYRKELADLHRDGWLRARIDGSLHQLDAPPELARYEKHDIEVVVDRLRIDRADRPRLAEAVETAVRLGQGSLVVLFPDRGADEVRELLFSVERSCPHHPEIAIPELEPRLFSFNAPQGACPDCNGLGALEDFDVDRLVRLDKRPVDAFQAFNDEGRLPFAHFDRGALHRVVKQLGGANNRKLSGWEADTRDRLLYGDPSVIVRIEIDRGSRSEVRERPWRGLVPMVRNVWKYTGYSPLQRFRSRSRCHACDGARLNAVARAVTFRGHTATELHGISVRDATALFEGLVLEGSEREVGEQLLREIRDRLGFLHRVGLGYLTLDRSAATLSGGEAQRIRLAAQVGSALEGVTYILDEPSIGLHPRDNRRLLEAMRRLRDRGNTVLVVEHDEETIREADWVIDVGPGAGREGGRIAAAGPPIEVERAPDSLTGAWLRGDRRIAIPDRRREGRGKLGVRGARAHNLQDVDADIPLGTLTLITGVSGSGKSSLVFEAIEASWRSIQADGGPVACDRMVGAAKVDKLIRISQTPIGRTPRSNPATYTKLFDPVRTLFAATPEARARGYKKGRFSFNVSGGRCESCQGAGVITVEMQFLPSVAVSCEVCGGRRFNAETREITWRGKSIDEVLELTVAEAAEFFAPIPKVARILDTMVAVGLGYVPLGQPSTTLSGGEAQRVKLATELHRPATGDTLYLLDEPTTGLHFEDVAKLLEALQRLVDAGNTVVVIEHHTDLIACADHIVDLGPEGGDGGGRIVGTGTPEELAELDTPTGRVLAAYAPLGLAARAPVAAEPVAPPMIPVRRGDSGQIEIRGARKHNLRDVDVDIPHGKMTVVTGVSGSGKTSLAFDTVFAEGQRQYVESLSTYARRFLGRVERAPVERVDGLQPAIAIDQKAGGHNPRSTVATVTEIHDVLRLLWARIGVPHCPKCGAEVLAASPSLAAARAARDPGLGWMLARLRPQEKGHEDRRDGLIRDGWRRLLHFEGGAPVQVDLDSEDALPLVREGAWLVIDRFDPATAGAARVSEAVAHAYKLGHGYAWFCKREDGSLRRWSERPTCEKHGVVVEAELTPRHFSFNSQLGACGRCDGLGVARAIVPERLLCAPKHGLWDALDGRVSSVLRRSPRNHALLEAMLAHHGASSKTPVVKLSEAAREELLYGSPRLYSLQWKQTWGATVRNVDEERPWPGLVGILEGWRSKLDWLTSETTCPACRGGRLRPELQAVTVAGEGIHQFARHPVHRALEVVRGWELSGEAETIAERPRMELERRLSFLVDVGVGYLGLSRAADTLSGGESQRIRLASQLGSGLTGVVYVLDEPTIGLHPRDTDRLLDTLEGLRDLGNTVLMVEHDTDTIDRADHVIDLGPEAGLYGGRVIAVGRPSQLAIDPDSVTGAWLSGRRTFPDRKKRRKARASFTLKKPTGNNLQTGTVKFPTGVWVGISGVSGSGKSTLVMDTLAPALAQSIGKETEPAPHGGLVMGEPIDRVVVVTQSPIGRSPRSTPATYCGLLDPIRKLFASTLGARERGWGPGQFSFNSPRGGRCTLCEGRGAVLVEMHFLPDVWVVCENCHGRRYGRETLEVRYLGKSIADVLSMRIDEAHDLLKNHRSIQRKLKALVDVGLGYLALGQPATTLSGGEAQRVKLASELTSRKGHCVYILDEPTTGLHLSDVAKLVEVLHVLVDKGHTVLTIEHHVEVLKQVDHLIDLGPEGGEAGGRVIAKGRPEAVARKGTATGLALRRAGLAG